jgi:hypothetical protein
MDDQNQQHELAFTYGQKIPNDSFLLTLFYCILGQTSTKIQMDAQLRSIPRTLHALLVDLACHIISEIGAA